MADIAIAMIQGTNSMQPVVGSIIAIKDGGYGWSKEMSIERWVSKGGLAADYHGDVGIIHAPNIIYNQELLDLYQNNHQTRNVVTGAVTHQYKYQIDLLSVPTPWAEDIATDYVITVDWNINQLKAFIKNRATGLYEA